MSIDKGLALSRCLAPPGSVQSGVVKEFSGGLPAFGSDNIPQAQGRTVSQAEPLCGGQDDPCTVEGALRLPPPVPAFRPGETVAIFRLLLFRYPLIEGQAVVVAPVPGHKHEYIVQFPGDARTRRRFVLPGDFQRDPAAMLDALRAVWRRGINPAIAEEFFAGLEAANDNREG